MEKYELTIEQSRVNEVAKSPAQAGLFVCLVVYLFLMFNSSFYKFFAGFVLIIVSTFAIILFVGSPQ